MATNNLSWWDDRLAYAGDSSRRIRDYRRLQSRWRETYLHLPPGTYRDRNGVQRTLGSRLPEGSGRREQLLSDEAVAYATKRMPALRAEGRGAEQERLWLNLLSSQPLCFSIFGHLDAHREAMARVLNAVLPWPVEAIETVGVEHAPASAAERLGGSHPDKTAFDAMLIVRSRGERLLLGVETKYTEPFSRREYDKSSYRSVCASQGSWFMPDIADIAKQSSTNQLWRNVMLAQESARDELCAGAVVVLTAGDDKTATAAVAGIQPLLADHNAHLAHVLLEDLMHAAAAEPTLAEWSTRFVRRYLDTSLSVPAKT